MSRQARWRIGDIEVSRGLRGTQPVRKIPSPVELATAAQYV
jgi:hypothetical protein